MYRRIFYNAIFWLFLSECLAKSSTVDSLKRVLTSSKQGEKKAFAMAYLAEAYAEKNQTDSCLIYAKTAFREARKILPRNAEAEAWYVLGQGYRLQNAHTLALTYYRSALALCKKLNYFGQNPYSEDNLQIKILLGISSLYAGYHVDSSLIYRKELLPLVERFKTYRLQAKITLDIGNSYLNGGDYAKALDFYFKSLEIKNLYRLNDLIDEDCQRAIGYLYVTLGDFQKAKFYLFMAKKFKESTKRGTYYEQAHLSNACEGLNQLDSALYFAEQAVKEVENQRVMHELGYIYMTYAKALERLNRFSQAMQWYRRGIEICLQQNNKKTLSVVYAETANLYGRMGKVDSSFYCAKEGVRFARESNFPRGI